MQFNPSACFVGLDFFMIMIFQNNNTVQQRMSTTSIPRFSLVNVLFFTSLLPLSSFFLTNDIFTEYEFLNGILILLIVSN